MRRRSATFAQGHSWHGIIASSFKAPNCSSQPSEHFNFESLY